MAAAEEEEEEGLLPLVVYVDDDGDDGGGDGHDENGLLTMISVDLMNVFDFFDNFLPQHLQLPILN